MILDRGEVAEHKIFGWRGTVTRVVTSPYSTTHVKLVEGGAPLPKVNL